MNVDYTNSTLVILAITIGIFIIIAINKHRNAPPPPSLKERITYQVETIYQLIKQVPDLRDFFMAAEKDGATYVQTYGGDGVAFYRVHDGIYEKRILSIPERPGIGNLGWVSNWQQCRELPPDVISISDAHVYPG